MTGFKALIPKSGSVLFRTWNASRKIWQKIPQEGIKRSSTEIFIEDRIFFLINSNGLEQEEEATELLVDFVLLAGKGPSSEGESQGIKRARFYKDLHLAEMVEKYARYTRESLEARLPQGRKVSGCFFGRGPGYAYLIIFASSPQGRPVFRTGLSWKLVSR